MLHRDLSDAKYKIQSLEEIILRDRCHGWEKNNAMQAQIDLFFEYTEGPFFVCLHLLSKGKSVISDFFQQSVLFRIAKCIFGCSPPIIFYSYDIHFFSYFYYFSSSLLDFFSFLSDETQESLVMMKEQIQVLRETFERENKIAVDERNRMRNKIDELSLL